MTTSLSSTPLSNAEGEGATDITHLLAHLDATVVALPSAVSDPRNLPPLAPPVNPHTIAAELARLPAENALYTHRQFSVYFGTQAMLPATVEEITRLREHTFRAFKEGSGKSVDTDRFDASYLHLVVWDTQKKAIVGGYRLGQTDNLRRLHGPDSVYLEMMFEFDDSFYEGTPMLEVGRSFVVPEYQKNHNSLHLLWCGIGRFLVGHPQYRRLYGVVSVSRLYDSRTIAAIRDALLEPSSAVYAKSAFKPDLGTEWRDYLASKSPMSMREVSRIVRALEGNKRDVPVLIRHYHKLGARFVSAAVDGNFNNTPGLLLCVDVPTIPARYLKRYFGDDAQFYLDYTEPG